MGLICTEESRKGWRDSLVLKDVHCSHRELKFCSQHHLSGGLKPPVCNSSSRKANAVLWPVRHTHACEHKYVCAHTYMNEILKKLQTPALLT